MPDSGQHPPRFAVGQRISSVRHIDVAITDPGAPRALLGAALFLGTTAPVGLGVVVALSVAGLLIICRDA